MHVGQGWRKILKSLLSACNVFVALTSVPVSFFNFLSPVIAVIWLVYLGEWAIVGWGIGYMMVGTTLISIALLPGLAFAGASAALEARGNTVMAVIVAIPALAWTLFIAGATSAYAMSYAATELDHAGSLVPYVLWAVVAATAPWDYMAMKEQQSSGEVSNSMVTASLLNVGCIVSFIGIVFFDQTELIAIALPISVAIILAQVLNLTYEFSRARTGIDLDF